MKKWALTFGNALNPGGQDHLGSSDFHIHFLYLTHRQGYYRAKSQHCQSIPTSTFVEQAQRPVVRRSAAIAETACVFRPVRRGRNGKADGFLWRGSATTPARSAGQRRVWGGNPNKYQTRGTNERSEIWATGRYLLSTTNAFPMPAHRSVTVQQIRQQKRICRSNLPDKRELTGFCFCDFRYCQL